MTVTAVHKDPDSLTMTLTAEFEASPTRVWELWADPRQLERWWGPPTYPATFTTHDLSQGSRVEYYITAINNGMTRPQVVEAFFNSPEFAGTVAPVTRLYFAFFNRIPDYPGLTFQVKA